MISQARAHKLTSNDLIDVLQTEGKPVVKTHTRTGTTYTLWPVVLPREVVEHQIAKGILVPREESGQSYTLSPAWGGVA